MDSDSNSKDQTKSFIQPSDRSATSLKLKGFRRSMEELPITSSDQTPSMQAASTLTYGGPETTTQGAVAAAVLLPGDAIFEILSWTPSRSVCRFRCVSKGWRDLISDPAFVAAHTSRTEPLLVASCVSEGDITDSELRLIDMDGNLVKAIRGGGGYNLLCTSSDDLVCVIGATSHRGPAIRSTRIINPATEEVLFVTWPPETSYAPIYGFSRAAAPPGAYKLFSVKNSRQQTCCNILTVTGGGNVEIRNTRPPPSSISCVSGSCMDANGAIYFLTTYKGDSLLRFNLEHEEWDLSEGPRRLVGDETWKNTTVDVHLTELSGVPCIAQWMGHQPPCTNVWLLRDFDKGIWIKAFTVTMNNHRSLMIPLMVTCASGKLLFYVRNKKELELKVYDPCTNVFTHITTVTCPYTKGSFRLCGSNWTSLSQPRSNVS